MNKLSFMVAFLYISQIQILYFSLFQNIIVKYDIYIEEKTYIWINMREFLKIYDFSCIKSYITANK